MTGKIIFSMCLLKNEPGSGFVYADIHALLIGLVIESASGMSLKDYAKKKLFDPLDISQVYWFTNASNQTGAAGNLYLTTLDFAKLGILVVNEGKWGEQRIISSEFNKRLIERKAFEISDYFPLSDAYGMLWYKANRKFGEKQFEYIFASGSGGNHLVVIPEEEMVIALTSSAYGPGYGQRRTFNIMKKILEAYKD